MDIIFYKLNMLLKLWIYFLPALFLFIVYLFCKRQTLKRIRYRRYFSSDGVFDGDEIELIEEVSNPTFFPVFRADICSLVPAEISLTGFKHQTSGPQSFISRFTLLPFMTVKRTHKAVCHSRGFYHLETAQIIWFKTAIVLDSPASLFIYPGLIPYETKCSLDSCLLTSITTSLPLFTDSFSFSGIRRYTLGDPFSSINFKATARNLGELYVNTNEFITGRSQMIYINFDSIPGITHEQYKGYMEAAFSYSSYLLDRAVQHGYRIGFAANCRLYNGKDYLNYPMSTGNLYTYMEILREMSSAQIRSSRSISSVLMSDAVKELKNCEIILMTLTINERIEESLEALKRLDNQISLLWLSEV